MGNSFRGQKSSLLQWAGTACTWRKAREPSAAEQASSTRVYTCVLVHVYACVCVRVTFPSREISCGGLGITLISLG